MKNLKIYYLAIIAPLIIIFIFYKFHIFDSTYLLIIFLIYATIYRTYTDSKRLIDKKIIPKKDFWKLLIPGTRIEHFRELYIK
ncbi:MAG: hypothetical protein COZ75_07010 [Flavobacteriaceae bacterium CG_4_8_14_3_um_filter_34_10]|nr:MAG: hypothetical protein COZ75_07010 [Flavobacteriaceae bacterium CG_4_8_14_3_um_filter_34_10]